MHKIDNKIRIIKGKNKFSNIFVFPTKASVPCPSNTLTEEGLNKTYKSGGA